MPNRFQKAAAQVYGGGDYSYICEQGYGARQLSEDITMHNFGDTLFNFVMIELDMNEGCETLEDAKRRIDVSIEDLQRVRAALDELED